MKNISILTITTVLILLFGCKKTVDIEAEKSAIQKVLTSYIVSIENEDIALYGKIFIHSSDMVNFGTGANERIVGWDALKKVIEAQNEALSDTKINQSEITINLSDDGKFAWATSLWDFNAKMGDQQMLLPVRCSWVLERVGDEWKIIHFHKSVGAAW
jgi:hypothetical protein